MIRMSRARVMLVARKTSRMIEGSGMIMIIRIEIRPTAAITSLRWASSWIFILLKRFCAPAISICSLCCSWLAYCFFRE